MMNRYVAGMALRSGYPLKVRINPQFSVVVQASRFTGAIYSTLKAESGKVYPRTRMTVRETLAFIKANY